VRFRTDLERPPTAKKGQALARAHTPAEGEVSPSGFRTAKRRRPFNLRTICLKKRSFLTTRKEKKSSKGAKPKADAEQTGRRRK